MTAQKIMHNFKEADTIYKSNKMKTGDKVQVYFSVYKEKPIKQGEVSEIIEFGGTNCIRLIGSNRPYAVDCVTKIKEYCNHHPFDRNIDWNENQYCTICGEITKTAEEIYSDEGFI